MSDDKLAFLDKPRDEAGRFAPSKQSAEPAPEPAASAPEQHEPAAESVQAPPPPQEPIAKPQPPPGHVPLEALLETREKAQRHQREAEEYKRKFEELTRKPKPTIDPIADPDGFYRSVEEQRQADRQDTLFETSWLIAQQQHGEETVKAAEEWLAEELKNNPGLYQTITRQRHPYDFVVKQHKRTLSFAKLGEDDPETWFEKQAKERGYVKLDEQQPAGPSAATSSPQPRAPLPRPSLINAPSAGGGSLKVPTGPGAAFGAVFKS
jgi:hypothetical protein